MKGTYENPTLLFRLIDDVGNNKLGSYVYKNYIKTLDLKGDEKILDLGSGSGSGSRHFAKLLSTKGGHLTCVDISPFWMEKAKKRMAKYDNVDYFIGQLPELKFEKESFDGVNIFYTLHHVSEDLRDGILKECRKILKDEGKIYIKEPQREENSVSIDEIVGLMQRNGFVKVYSVNEDNAYRAVYKKRKLKKEKSF